MKLKLYLTMTMLAARPPHDIRSIPARTWAEVLALPDPEVNGARRVADALNWLQQSRLIRLDSRQGMPKDVTLLSPSGTGTAYSWRGAWYVRVPLGFWQNEWIYRLSGTAVGFLLVLRDMRSNRAETDPPWLTTTQKQRYGFSDDTWTRATKELQDHGLLVIRRRPQGKEFDHRRLRNSYWIDIDRLDQPNEPAAQES
ncbi:MAG: hypothetical protein HKP61_17670 [Dactylosporangium sp.]|nr:hypothetical protein [Dactylosporangium sp.]